MLLDSPTGTSLCAGSRGRLKRSFGRLAYQIKETYIVQGTADALLVIDRSELVGGGCLLCDGQEEEEDEDDEDAESRPAGVYRRLIFLENEGIVQTEVMASRVPYVSHFV